MKRITVVFTFVVLIMGISALGQQKGLPIPPRDQIDNICVEDDATGNFLSINIQAGEFKFYRCKDGLSMSCQGLVKIDGCSISLEDVHGDHCVLVSVDMCSQFAKATVQRYQNGKLGFMDEPFKEFLADQDMRDNTMSCARQK